MSRNDKRLNKSRGPSPPDRADPGTSTKPPSSPNSNRSLYADGRRGAKLLARGSAKGESKKAVLYRVAAESGRSPADVRSAIRFADAVDLIARNVGPAAKKVLLAGGPRLAPKVVMKIANTHSDRQAYAMGQVAQGRGPFAKSRDGSGPPFDTKDVGEVHSRLCRFAGLLNYVTAGLADTPVAAWPADEVVSEMAHNLAAVRKSCETLSGMLKECAHDPKNLRTLKHRIDVSQGRSQKARRPFRPNRASGFVAAVRVVSEKNVRELPRVLQEAPPSTCDRDTLLEGVRTLDLAVNGLNGVIRVHAGKVARGADPNGPVAWTRVKQVPGGPERRGGTYVVVFGLDAAVRVTVGRLGTFDFPAGYYCYVGSAFGGGGVRARTARHRTPIKANKKWNIDYLTPYARAVEVWWTHDEVKRECRWSDALAASDVFSCPAPEFGARDCKKCPAHLYFSVRRPCVHDFAARLRRMVPGHAQVYRLRVDGDVRLDGKSVVTSRRVAVQRPGPGSNAEGRLR